MRGEVLGFQRAVDWQVGGGRGIILRLRQSVVHTALADGMYNPLTSLRTNGRWPVGIFCGKAGRVPGFRRAPE